MTPLKAKKEIVLKSLQAVLGIIEKRHTMPIFSHVLIKRRHNKLYVLGSDGEIQIEASCFLEDAGEPMSFTTPAKKLADILRFLPDEAEIELKQKTEIKLDSTQPKMVLKSGKSKFTLHSFLEEDFPCVVVEENEISLKIPQADLRALLNKVHYAAASQDIRTYLNGVYIATEKNKVVAVATDGHRLAFESRPITATADVVHSQAIVPRKTIIELSKLLNDTCEMVKIKFSPNQICFCFDSIELISKVIAGKFPDYANLIPTTNEKIASINRLAFLRALQRVSVLSNEKYRGVRVSFSSKLMRIQAVNIENEEASEDLEINYPFESTEVGFNFQYLLDALNNSGSEEIQLALSNSDQCTLMTEAGNHQFKYVVMPMRL